MKAFFSSSTTPAEGRVCPEATRIIGLFPELLGVGGIQEAGRLTAAALQEIGQRRGWRTIFLSLNDSQGPHTLCVAEQKISIRGFARNKISFALAAVVESRLRASSDGGIIVGAHPHLAVPAAWARRISPRFKTIVMTHGIEIRRKLTAFRRRALLEANLLLAPSRDTASSLRAFQSVPAAKIHKLAWPLSPDFLEIAAAPASHRRPPAFPGGSVILTVGRMASSDQYKGTDSLILAVAKLSFTIPDLHLVAVGNGDDIPRLRQVARGAGIVDRVHFLSGCSREELAACYADAKIFALPSTGEGFGLVFLEAMAFSKPVVAVSAGGATDLIEDGVNGLLVPPADVDRLAQALGRLLNDDAFRAGLGARGGEIVRQRFTFSAFEAALEEILNEFVAGRSPALNTVFAG